MKRVIEIRNSARIKEQTNADSRLEEKIRHRAYELYEERAHEDGHELQDWLQAEAEVKRNAVAA